MPTAHYSLRLLGRFDVRRNGRRSVGACYGKMQALLAYLAAEADQTHTRQALAGLLWPERDEDHARQSLRQALTGLRAALGDEEGPGGLLAANRETIALNRTAYQIDIEAFDGQIPGACPDGLRARSACRGCHQSAAAHYRGPFLAGLSLPDAPEFDSWLALKRERFARRAAELYAHLAACHEQSGEFPGALRYARQQLRIDPWDEDAHRQVIRLLALGGSRNAALAHYRRMRALLAAELGVEPDAATRELYTSIRAGHMRRAVSTPAERLAGTASPWTARECAMAPQGHAGERHSLTVLSLELRAGTQADPETLWEAARCLERIACERIPDLGGTVRESGNLELIAYFGYPRPCDQPAVQAVRAALALRADLAPLAPRIRVHSGLVFVPPRVRGACETDFSLVSAVPLVARRLQRVAPEIEVAISEASRVAAGDALDTRCLTPMGDAESPESIAVHEVLRVRTHSAVRASPSARRVRRDGHAGRELDVFGSAKPLAQLAAHLGPTFSEAQLHSLLCASGQLGFDLHELAAQMDSLLERGVWDTCRRRGTTHYRFRDPSLRRAALQGQSLAARRLYRRLLAASRADARR